VNTGNLPTTANTSLCVKRVTHCTLLDESNNSGAAGEHENGAAQASLGIILLDRSNKSPPQDAESDTTERRVPSGFAPPCRRPGNCLQEHLQSGEVKNAVSALLIGQDNEALQQEDAWKGGWSPPKADHEVIRLLTWIVAP
jgi:hypothetical protein